MSCYDWDADGGHDLIGVFFTSLSELRPGQGKLRWDLINEKKRAKKKGYKNSGVVQCTVEVSEMYHSLPARIDMNGSLSSITLRRDAGLANHWRYYPEPAWLSVQQTNLFALEGQTFLKRCHFSLRG